MRRSNEAFSVGIAVWFCAFAVTAVPSTLTFARVDPLTIIKRQIHKPNMLILLDTSGSLTGVPGGSFDNSDEVGVDCDDGQNCRGGISEGICAGTGKGCASDNDCRTSSCASGFAACVTNADCPPVAGTCSTGQTCFADADCPALTSGHCDDDNQTCNANKKCSARLRCRQSNQTCTKNSDCRPGVCADGSTFCSNDDDCPFQVGGGTCAWGTTPGGGCSKTSDCPVRPKACSDDPSKSCNTVNDCGGSCRRSGKTCSSSQDCRDRRNDWCDYSGKTCSAPANSCLLPRQSCGLVYGDNVCEDRNACIPDPNPCTGASATNQCLPGADGDVCNATSASSGSRMCRLKQTRCTSDSTCTMSGDSCGPATSRFVIAKRVISNIVDQNANVLNLGLMTFTQDRYFPYYTQSSTTTVTRTVFIKHGTLQGRGCYSRRDGLDATCVISGTTYTLKSGANTRYQIKGHGNGQHSVRYVDNPYCDWFCDIDGIGTGVFTGAYYEYQDVQGTPSTLSRFDTYQGKSFSNGGTKYRYYDARPDYYNGGPWPPIDYPDCNWYCDADCGGRWDPQLAPFLSTDDSPANIDAIKAAFNQAMEPASYGGLISIGGTPSGCALENTGSPTRNHSAYHYMQDVKGQDTLACRQNFVLFITDGEANGPGDNNCSSSACAAADPAAAGCGCHAVLAAYRMRQNLGVRTFVVGFSVDAAAGTGRLINDNIARAGGTDAGEDGAAPFAFGAANENELNKAIQQAIYQAVRGSYATSPASASQGSQQGNAVRSGALVLDARVDFPSWNGHLIAYDVSGDVPELKWDAATQLRNTDWWRRRIYTSTPQNGLVKVEIDPATHAIANAALLHSLGLGATVEEAASIARWMMGDPAMGNPAVLGSIINSTPVDVGPPPETSLPGGHDFHVQHRERPALTYVGADDGMLHAFFTRTISYNGATYEGGSEAFAYIPPSMLRTISRLYAQGGQVSDPRQHIYGLASSPKMKNVCVDDCNDSSAVWKTLLAVPEGWGGNGSFVLDVTDPFSGSLPFQVLWTTDSVAESQQYDNALGLTLSVPAFTFYRTDEMNDYRLMMGSGYRVDPDSPTQGRKLISTSLHDGRILAEVPIEGAGSCQQEYGVLTDVATSRQQIPSENGVKEGRKELIAAYMGDTWGNLWRHPKAGGMELVASLGCSRPLHYSPTVVQLDQDDPNNPHANDIYLVQVTNSTLDENTEDYAPSQMVIIKERANEGVAQVDPTFGSNGMVVLSSDDTTQMCGETDATGQTCVTPLPDGARPLSTPIAAPKPDGNGFLILSTWYSPAQSGCGKGATYFLMHEVVGAQVAIKQAVKIADEPVVSAVIAGGKMMIAGSDGPVSIDGAITTTVVGAHAPSSKDGDVFRTSGWTEVE